MPISVRKLPERPVIFVRVSGETSTQDILDYFQEVDEILTRYNASKFYLVADMHDAEMSFNTIYRGLDASGQVPGGMYDPRMIPIIIADMAFGEMLRGQIDNRFPDVNMPFFESRADAFSFVAFLLSA